MNRSLLLLSLVILVIAGCQGTFQQPQNQDLGTFVGGTQALDIAFAEDQPPAAVLDDGQETFFITLLLRNVGEHTITAGGLIASLSGIVQSSFAIKNLNAKNTFDIYGAGKDGNIITPGAEDLLEFGGSSFQTDLPGDTEFTLRADVCYNYQTQAVSKLCLKQNVLARTIDDVCIVNDANLAVENSGSSVHVTAARQNTIGSNKVKLTFTIKNLGVGAVFEPNTFTNTCVGKEDERDKLNVNVYNPENNFKIECGQFGGSNQGTVKLINNEKIITCTVDTTNLQEFTFQDLVIFELNYMERLAVTTPIRVVNALF